VAPRPIGIFDSGVGGLSVAREIALALPQVPMLYVADTAWCPYGDRPVAQVRERALTIARHLEGEGARLVVVACNTASGAALEDVRSTVAVPVIGLEPAVKTAASRTAGGRIGVMATSGTLASERYARLVRDHAAGREVVAQACPGLADLIESGHLEGPTLESRLRELVAPLVAAGVEAVVLGCTHYPFVREAIARALGGGVLLVDSGPAIARRAASLLSASGADGNGGGGGGLRVATTGDPGQVRPVVERLWGAPLEVSHVDL
jgi:glutamate racemase